jgi:hypothetical protein
MTNEIDYKRVIDVDLKWHLAPEERTVRDALAELSEDSPDRYDLFDRLRNVETTPPIVKVGLYNGVKYAFQARAEWEILHLADILGDKLKEEYNLHGSLQAGIALDWTKLGERIWIPADYVLIERENASIFSVDEGNLISMTNPTEEDTILWEGVIYRPLGLKNSSETKITALTTSQPWRDLARQYSQRALHHAAFRYRDFVDAEFQPVLEALVSDYAAQMK